MSKEERKAREKENRKNLILKAALKSFSKYGYHKCTMDLIAEEAELGKATLYYYFKNKDELLLEVLRSGLDNFFNRLNKEWEKLESSGEKISSISVVAADFFYENPDFFKLYSYLSLHPKIKRITEKEIRPIIAKKTKSFAKLFKQAANEGVIKPFSPQLLIQIFGALIMGIGAFGHYKRKADITKKMNLINEIFFHGIAADEDKK